MNLLLFFFDCFRHLYYSFSKFLFAVIVFSLLLFYFIFSFCQSFFERFIEKNH
ncbi:hypothetical protein HMPREF3213_02906 [Heyndrickxia coagulans]|uniref:Uncharacterized protein n=1 Tax=Heyndrickxia coagulans TaxID=1398 RepID=A0A133KGV3_HEYCO|nr:hypothetical protein HMPREF3213_02906 [Heyndrickxia coagulans]